MNLIMSIYFLWISSIVQVFDFLTFDIFFDNLISFDISAPSPMCPITHGKWWWGIWAMWHVPLLDLHGGRIMGQMGNRAHEQWGRVMGNRGNGYLGDRAHCHNYAYIYMGTGWWGTWTIGHSIQWIYSLNIYLWDARGEIIVHIFAWK